MEEKNYNSEIDISIKDIVFFLLKRWKSLFIMSLIGIIVGAGIYGLQKQIFEKNTSIDTTEAEKHSVVSSGLDKSSIEKMNIAYEYYSLYQKQLDYMNNSLLVALDVDHVYVGELQYYLSSGENIPTIKNYYGNIIKDQAILEEIKMVIDQNTDVKYIAEILGVEILQDNNISVYMNNENPMDSGTIITYRMWYDDREVIQKVLDILEEKIQKLNGELVSQYGPYEQNSIGCYIQSVRNSEFLNGKKSAVDTLQNYIVSMLAIQGQMTEKENDYYERYYLNREDNAEDQGEQFQGSLIKYTGLCVIAFCFCWGVYGLILYFLNGSVKCSDEIIQRYNLNLLGHYVEDEEKKGIDKWLLKIKKKYYISGDSLEYIVQSIVRAPGEKKYICFDSKSLKEKQLAEKLMECSKIQLHHVHFDNMENLSQIRKGEGVILFVELEHTLKKEVQTIVKMCNVYDTPIIGTIIVE